jgi:MFS family permease
MPYVEHRPAAASTGIFRGWWVLAGIFIVMTTGSGFAFYAQGVFLDALVNEQGFSVGIASAGTGTFFLVSGVAGYYAGGLIAKVDIRVVMTAGSLVAAAGIALIGQVRTTWQMFAVFVLFGTGYAFAGLVPTTSLVTRWFHRRRSLALAIASTGLSMGGIAITPLLAQLIEKRSLVSLAPWFAVAYLAGIIPIVWLLLRVSPESMGLRPDGDAPAFDEPDDVVLPGTSFALAVRSGYFKIVSVGFVILMSAQVGALQHLFKLTKDRIDIDAASLALIVVTATSVVGRIAGGLAAMRFPLMRLVSVLAVVQAIGIAIIAVSDSIGMILLGCVVLGSAMGNLLMLHPLLLADAFGVRDYSRIYGLGALLMVFGVGLGPFNVGILRDATDYRTAFLAMAALALVGLAVLRLAPAPPTPDSGPH